MYVSVFPNLCAIQCFIWLTKWVLVCHRNSYKMFIDYCATHKQIIIWKFSLSLAISVESSISRRADDIQIMNEFSYQYGLYACSRVSVEWMIFFRLCVLTLGACASADWNRSLIEWVSFQVFFFLIDKLDGWYLFKSIKIR